MRAILACSVVLGLSVMGCGGATIDPGGSDSGSGVDAARADSGPGPDAAGGTDGAPGTDSGRDAALTTDTGTVSDSGTDAAVDTDAAVGTDAATTTDAGNVCHSDSDCPSSSTTRRFCEFPDGMCSGNGLCTDVPGFCPGFITTRVCGCDGNTYNNGPCAHSHGTSVANPSGPCPTSTCGCASDGDCASDEECVIFSDGGVCKTKVSAPSCWRDDDCSGGEICMSAGVCHCGRLCIVADHPGTCG